MTKAIIIPKSESAQKEAIVEQECLTAVPSTEEFVKPLPFTLAEVRKAMPAEVFEKSLPKSLFYLFFDFAMWGLTFYTMWTLTHSPLWQESLTWPVKAAITLVYWNIVGFFMWCIFVVGHDCGHKTFSVYPLVNDVLGHVCHGSISVPYYPWQLSHHYHHLYHNHLQKDFSYLWFPEDILVQRPIAKAFHKSPTALFLFPFYGYFMYLWGMPDGCHYIPNMHEHRLWDISPKHEAYKCLLSSSVCLLNLFGQYLLLSQNWTNVCYYYLAPLAYFSWWLVTVTYLQHHHEHSVVFDNHDWQYLIGGLETVDRTFGFGIDALHHHITDCHVIHHLFFTQIPHYHLPRATRALQEFIHQYQPIVSPKSYYSQNNTTTSNNTITNNNNNNNNNNNINNNNNNNNSSTNHYLPLEQRMYKHEDTRDFMWRIHKYMLKIGFRTKRASPVPAAEAEQQENNNHKNSSSNNNNEMKTQ